MGTNASWLVVKLGKASRFAALERSVIASYEERGARLLSREHDPSLERMAELSKHTRLGIAIAPPERGWVCIVDSRGGTSDARLAEDLAKSLETTVLRCAEIDAANFYGIERLGERAPLPRPTPYCDGYQDLENNPQARFLLFGGVTAKAYREGESASVAVRCSKCRYPLGWTPGYDVPPAPSAEQLFSLTGKKLSKTPRVLVVLHCNQCGSRLGFGEALLFGGLLEDCKLLASTPKTLAGFDAALVSQRETIEAALPTPETVAARKNADQPIEKALSGLALKAQPGKPPPLSLVFASSREELIRAFEKQASSFDFRPDDLPGKLDLQLVAWLGPKPKSRAVAVFIDSTKKLLGPGSFARLGRSPKTSEWMTAVGFPLDDRRWAALLLFEHYAEGR